MPVAVFEVDTTAAAAEVWKGVWSPSPPYKNDDLGDRLIPPMGLPPPVKSTGLSPEGI